MDFFNIFMIADVKAWVCRPFSYHCLSCLLIIYHRLLGLLDP